jgi:murein L,D-transpeptidase YcbB/YkuD
MVATKAPLTGTVDGAANRRRGRRTAASARGPGVAIASGRLWVLAVLALWAWGCGGSRPPVGRARLDWNTAAPLALQRMVGGTEAAPVLRLPSGPVPVGPELVRFYRQRGFRPAWCSPFGALPQVGEMTAALDQVVDDGLRPEDYRRTRLVNLVAACGRRRPTAGGLPAPGWLELELLLTDAFLRCAGDLARGRIEPRPLLPDWRVTPAPVDLVAHLQRALGAGRVDSALAALRPAHPGYRRLRDALRSYRLLAAAGEWAKGPDAPLGPGSSGAAVVGLNRRLTAAGDLPQMPADSTVWNQATARGVQRFQRRHGLPPTGKVDRATREAIGVTPAARVQTLTANLERWRWLPHAPARPYLLVRLADQWLEAVRGDSTALGMPVITGRLATPTPVFSALLTAVQLNPYWFVPRSIAVNEILPQVQADTSYLAAQGLRVALGTGDDARVVPPETIDWAAQDSASFTGLFLQPPGEGNALGKAKFLLANRFDVYLHDTPDGELFARSDRQLSHGCIRLSRWLDVATFVLGSPWEGGQLDDRVATGKTQTLELATPMPVYLVWWSAWVDEAGDVQFRPDRDHLDAAVLAAMEAAAGPLEQQPPPPP